LIYEPWKATIRQQSKARCIIGVDYPSRIVTEKEIEEIFENAKFLLKKNHNIDLDLKMQKFDNSKKAEVISSKSEENLTLKNQIPKPEKNKFRGTVKESTRIGTVLGDENSQELVSEERIIFRETIEDHKIDSMKIEKDPREEVIHLQTVSKEKKIKNIPEHLIENRVAGQKEVQKDDHFELIHYRSDKKKPQMAWHKIDSKNGKITFIDKCTGIENKKILSRKKKVLESKGFSFKNNDTKSQIDNLMKLNDKLIKMAQSHEESIEQKNEESINDYRENEKELIESFYVPKSHKLVENLSSDQKLANLKSSQRDTQRNESGILDDNSKTQFKNSKRVNVVSKTFGSSQNNKDTLNMNPLEITTIKCQENGQNTVICHVKVDHNDMNKSVDFNITNEDNNKKIMVFSRKSISKNNEKKKKKNSYNEERKEKETRKERNEMNESYDNKMNFFMENNKRIDTDEFFKTIMKRNEEIIKANNFNGMKWEDKLNNLKKRSDSQFKN
jgi:hypothetical protein